MNTSLNFVCVCVSFSQFIAHLCMSCLHNERLNMMGVVCIEIVFEKKAYIEYHVWHMKTIEWPGLAERDTKTAQMSFSGRNERLFYYFVINSWNTMWIVINLYECLNVSYVSESVSMWILKKRYEAIWYAMVSCRI